MGGKTRSALLHSALELFSRHWYETVSVAEICRNAGLSNGIFYRYFANKEKIFRTLLDDFITSLEESLENIGGSTPSEALEQFLHVIAEINTHSAAALTVFREGQYRFPEYERRLRRMYTLTLNRLLDREIEPAEYLYITAGIRFLIYRALQTGVAVRVDEVRNIIFKGVFTLPVRNTVDIFLPPRSSSREEDGIGNEEHNTRGELMSSGMRLFGEKGFYNVNVYEIAREAGFSVGTFYLYFPGKEAFLSKIVDLIGLFTRRFISMNLLSGCNRLETELRGMFLFLHYFASRRHYYEIVREAEFVVKDTVRRYYDAFAEGYRKNLTDVRPYDSYTLSNALIGISHYLGIETLFTHPDLDSEKTILQLGHYLLHGLEI